MNPFFFGSSARPLYGVYEPPGGSDLRRGAVICSAVGREYYHAHRACRSLTRRICAAGVHTLRFDYLGTGDSGGEVEDFEVRDWVDNVGQAVDELRDMTGVVQVSLVGLRLGAAIASRAVEERGDVASLVLWDPLADPTDALRELDLDEFPPAFVAELGELDWPRAGQELVRTTLVTTGPSRLGERVQEHGETHPTSGYRVVECRGPQAWRRSGDFGHGGLPVAVLDEIAECVTEV